MTRKIQAATLNDISIKNVLSIGFLYGIQSDTLDPEEVLHKLNGYFHTRGYEESCIALESIIGQLMDEVIGQNEKPHTYVQRYPGSIAPGSIKSTRLSGEERAINQRLKSQRQTKQEILKREFDI